MNVGSLFTGVGGFDLGFERAGMRIVFQCERDEWCRGILAQHWPDVPCYDDVRSVGMGRRAVGDAATRSDGWTKGGDWSERAAPSLDLLCGGFPCQDLSVAGKRAGLAGERSGLFFEFARIADELVRPGGWIVVENVPGLLSSAGGRDFAVLLRTLGDIGFHDLAWRVLDSRYFGVPQRRRRVFIVGRRAVGDGAREVLLESEGGGGDFAPSREAGPRVAASLSRGSASPGVSAPGRRQEDDENIVSTLQGGSGRRGHRIDAEGAAGNHLIAPALVKRYDCLIAHTLRATGRGTPLVHIGEPARGGTGDAVREATDTGRRQAGAGLPSSEDRLGPSADTDGVRATPGLPGRVDDPRPDGPRYAAMGNAVTVNVLEWIGHRIMSYEDSSK